MNILQTTEICLIDTVTRLVVESEGNKTKHEHKK